VEDVAHFSQNRPQNRIRNLVALPPGKIHRWRLGRWADEPIEPHLVARIMCAVYSTKRIPVDLQASREAMEQFASAFAKERKWRVGLVLSKRTRVWFNEQGQRTGVTEDSFEESFGPYMQIGGKRFVLGLLDRSGLEGTGNR
jgi:hypothetical protein